MAENKPEYELVNIKELLIKDVDKKLGELNIKDGVVIFYKK